MDPNEIRPGTAEVTEEGEDDDGNPTVSVNIGVPAAKIGATPGEVN